MLHSVCQQIWKTLQWPQCWQRSVFIPIQKKGNSKECSFYHAIVLISLASKVILKILQAKLHSTWTENWELRTGLRNQRSNCQHPLDHIESMGIPEKKHLHLLHWLCESLSLCGPQQTVENSYVNGSPRSPYLSPESLYVGQKVAVRIRHGTTKRFKIGKAAWQGIHCYSGYWTCM